MAIKEGMALLQSEQSIRNFLNKEDIKALWWGHRYGDSSSKEKFVYQHSTKLPTMRDSLWYSDGTKLNYYYQYQDKEGNNKIGTCKVYEVMDAYSEVLLGYDISHTEDYATQYRAYKMAVQIAGHRPYQLGFDNQGGHKKLEAGAFLTKLARLCIKTQPYNGKSKTIESAFNRFQSAYMKQDWFFTGMNIQSKKEESKSNMEFIMANKAELPTLAEVKATYLKRRTEWNNAVHPASGKSRMITYLESSNEKAPAVTMWDMIDLFWIMRPKPITCNSYGITFQDNKEDYTYVVYTEDGLPDVAWLRKNIDKKYYIKYDPDDMSIIHLYDDNHNGMTYICEARQKIEINRGKQEQDDWEMEFYNAVESIKVIDRVSTADEMDAILESHNALPEQQGMKTPKLLGVKGQKKKAEPSIAKVQKVMSNMDAMEEEEYDPNEIYKLM
jgi:hypothetical protein